MERDEQVGREAGERKVKRDSSRQETREKMEHREDKRAQNGSLSLLE